MVIMGNKRIQNGWAFYDWANSVHALVITTAIFPLYYADITSADGTTTVEFFGHTFENTSLINYAGAIAFLILCIITPVLSGVADYTDNKKTFLKFFCYLGAFSTAALFFFKVDGLWYGLIFYMLSLIGFWCSVVFYNSYLPLIADRERHDSLSAKGYALGYVGSTTLLIICLVLIKVFDWKANWTFPLVALWWIIFAQVTFRRLPNKILSDKKSASGSPLTSGFKELKWVYSQLKKTKRLKKYLTAFFVYSMGVQTVMLVAVYFGEKKIIWDPPEQKTTGLIVSILIIQFIAIGGAYTMSWVSKKIGNVKTLIVTNVIWVIICLTAMSITLPNHFYLEAGLVGFVMGGIQSMSRSTYAKFLPKTNNTASFFSFFDVSEKLGIVFGLFIFGLLEELVDMRVSVGALSVFFFFGLLLLFRVPKDEISIELDH